MSAHEVAGDGCDGCVRQVFQERLAAGDRGETAEPIVALCQQERFDLAAEFLTMSRAARRAGPGAGGDS